MLNEKYFLSENEAKAVMYALMSEQRYARYEKENETSITNGYFRISLREESDLDQYGNLYDFVVSVKLLEPLMAHSRAAAEEEAEYYKGNGWKEFGHRDNYNIFLKSPDGLLIMRIYKDPGSLYEYWISEVGFMRHNMLKPTPLRGQLFFFIIFFIYFKHIL